MFVFEIIFIISILLVLIGLVIGSIPLNYPKVTDNNFVILKYKYIFLKIFLNIFNL